MSFFNSRNDKQNYKYGSYDTKHTTTCPNCGRIIPLDAIVCPYCDKKVEQKDSVISEELFFTRWKIATGVIMIIIAIISLLTAGVFASILMLAGAILSLIWSKDRTYISESIILGCYTVSVFLNFLFFADHKISILYGIIGLLCITAMVISLLFLLYRDEKKDWPPIVVIVVAIFLIILGVWLNVRDNNKEEPMIRHEATRQPEESETVEEPDNKPEIEEEPESIDWDSLLQQYGATGVGIDVLAEYGEYYEGKVICTVATIKTPYTSYFDANINNHDLSNVKFSFDDSSYRKDLNEGEVVAVVGTIGELSSGTVPVNDCTIIAVDSDAKELKTLLDDSKDAQMQYIEDCKEEEAAAYDNVRSEWMNYYNEHRSEIIDVDVSLLQNYSDGYNGKEICTAFTINSKSPSAIEYYFDDTDTTHHLDCSFKDSTELEDIEEGDTVAIIGNLSMEYLGDSVDSYDILGIVPDNLVEYMNQPSMSDCHVIAKGDAAASIKSALSENRDAQTSYAENETANAKAQAVAEEENIANDYKSKCSEVKSEDVLRNPSSYEGSYLKVSGVVTQVIDHFLTTTLRVTATDGGDWTIIYTPGNETRALEGDSITAWGLCEGTGIYTTVLGKEVTVPKVRSEYMEFAY